jgi:hypothetical protein
MLSVSVVCILMAVVQAMPTEEILQIFQGEFVPAGNPSKGVTVQGYNAETNKFDVEGPAKLIWYPKKKIEYAQLDMSIENGKVNCKGNGFDYIQDSATQDVITWNSRNTTTDHFTWWRREIEDMFREMKQLGWAAWSKNVDEASRKVFWAPWGNACEFPIIWRNGNNHLVWEVQDLNQESVELFSQFKESAEILAKQWKNMHDNVELLSDDVDSDLEMCALAKQEREEQQHEQEHEQQHLRELLESEAEEARTVALAEEQALKAMQIEKMERKSRRSLFSKMFGSKKARKSNEAVISTSDENAHFTSNSPRKSNTKRGRLSVFKTAI